MPEASHPTCPPGSKRPGGRVGDELKKALRPAAEAEFGAAFTVRAFNVAYAACYRRARGRPKRG